MELAGVAGVYAPAFVERPVHAADPDDDLDVSPGFTLRPSLSASAIARRANAA